MSRKQVGILIFDDVEVLDFCGPFEVFSVTRLDEDKRREEQSPFEVHLIAESRRSIATSGGMTVAPHHSIESAPPLDVLVIPGGWGTRREIKNPRLLEWIRDRGAAVETLTSVCTGAMLLGKTGLLDGRRATTHWRSLDWMTEAFPQVHVERQQHVVRDGNVFTSAGISAGIDMALQVVTHYFGEAIGRATARQMEYPYPDDNRRRV